MKQKEEEEEAKEKANEEGNKIKTQKSMFNSLMKKAIIAKVEAKKSLLNIKTTLVKEAKSVTFSDKSCCEKFTHILSLPDDWIRRLTILPCQATEYDKWYTIVWPYFGIQVTQMIVMK